MPQNPVIFIIFIDDLVEKVMLIRFGDERKPARRNNNYNG